MANTALRTPKLPPRKVIATCAYGADGDALLALDLRVDAGTDGWSLLFEESRKTRADLDRLLDDLQLSRSKLLSVPTAELVNSRAIGPEMVSQLVHPDWINDESAVRESGERMVVAPRIDDRALVELLNRVNVHSTCCRAAQFDTVSGDPLTLFHLRDDPLRGSSLQAFIQAYRGKASPVLYAYSTPSGKVFLPVAPSAFALRAVASLIERAPALFNFAEPEADGWFPEALLFAAVRASDFPRPSSSIDNEDFFFDAREARFFGAAAFAPDVERPRMVPAVPSPDQEGDLRNLRARLQAPDGPFAFPLRLRKAATTQADDTGARIQSMEAEKRILEGKILNLRAREAVQSVLLVAPEGGFDAVMRLLRSVFGRRRSWQGIRYRFAAAEDGDTDTARHVFWFGQSVAKDAQLFGMLIDHPDVRQYWSDPTWTAQYANHAKTTVMVPMGMRLTPFPHAWEASEMDEYIREMVDIWSEGAICLPQNEEHAIVFDLAEEAGDSGDRTPTLTVLVGAEFQSLSGDTIAWFNDVSAARATVASRVDITALAQAIDALTFRTHNEARLESAVDDLNKQVAAMEAGLDQALKDFEQVIGKTLADLREQISSRTADIGVLERSAAALEEKYKYARRKLTGMEGADSVFTNEASAQATEQYKSVDSFLALLDRQEKASATALDTLESKVIAQKRRIAEFRKSVRFLSAK